MSIPVRVVVAHFPEWKNFEDTVRRDLAREPHELTGFVGLPTFVELPQVLVDDFIQAANALGDGWSIGRVLSYLAVQGAMRVVEQAQRHAQG